MKPSQITAETHRILLNRLVADFGDKLVENGVLTVENVATSVHPESYEAAAKLLKVMGYDINQISSGELIRGLL